MKKIAVLTLLCCSLSTVQSSAQYIRCQKPLPLPFCGGKNQQPCFTSCSNPKFNDCPDFYTLNYDPKVCGYTRDGRWVNFNSECQACKNSDVTAVVGKICSCDFVRCTPGKTCKNGQCVDTVIRPDCRVIRCANGFQCVNGKGCVAIKTDPCGGKCKSYEFCSPQGQCLDNCARIRCASGYTCQKGQCVPDKPSDPCGGKCKSYEFCNAQNRCMDNCAFIKCTAGNTCQKGQCVPDNNNPIDDPSCAAVLCLQGTKCVNGKCVPIKNDDKQNNNKNKKIKCLSPRPNQENCPVIFYFRAPDPVACGIDKSGNKQDYSQICSACKDTKNIFYYEVPCSQVRQKKQCLPNEKQVDEKCIKVDQKICQDDNDCSFADFCINGQCQDKCKFAKCALGFTCRFGNCVPDMKIKRQCINDNLDKCGKK